MEARFFQDYRVSSAKLLAIFDQLVGFKSYKGGRYLLVRCATTSCDGTLRASYVTTGKTRFCLSCRTASQKMKKSDDHEKRMSGANSLIVSIVKKKGWGYKFTMRCSGKDCAATRSFSYERRFTCANCWGKTRRLPEWERQYRFAIYKARKRKFIFTLTLQDFKKVVSCETCFYCKNKVSRERGYSGNGKKPSMAHGIDRIDSARGYEVGNVTSCCWPCNKDKAVKYTCRQWAILKAMERRDKAESLRLFNLTERQVMQEAALFIEAYDRPSRPR